MFETILVPLDGSDRAAAALPVAREMARRFGGRLWLVQAIQLGNASFALGANAATGGLTDPAVITSEVEARAEVARAYLSGVAEQLGDVGLQAEYEVRDGPPGDAIIEAAGEARADLIVMSSHGHGGLGRLVFGSVTDHVVRNSRAPVLVVRGQG